MPHSFTRQEEENRARSLGVSISQFRTLTPLQREQGASRIGTFLASAGSGGEDGTPPPPFPDPTGVGGASPPSPRQRPEPD